MDQEFRAVIIRVTYPFWRTFFADVLDIKSTDTQGQLQEKGAYALLHELFQLPESYSILGVYVSDMGRIWNVGVTGPGLPVVCEGCEIPVVTPIFVKHENGVVELERIEGL